MLELFQILKLFYNSKTFCKSDTEGVNSELLWTFNTDLFEPPTQKDSEAKPHTYSVNRGDHSITIKPNIRGGTSLHVSSVL
jgi:hypothetical protein